MRARVRVLAFTAIALICAMRPILRLARFMGALVAFIDNLFISYILGPSRGVSALWAKQKPPAGKTGATGGMIRRAYGGAVQMKEVGPRA